MSPAAAALLLPGMSLNATIFPDLGMPTIASDFHAFAPAEPGMAPYVGAVDRLTDTALWREAQHRIVVAHSFGGMLALSWLLHASPTARLATGMVLIGTTAGPMYDAVRLRVAWWGKRAVRVPITGLMGAWNARGVTRAVQRIMNAGSLTERAVDFRALPYTDDIRIGLAGWRATSWEARRAFRTAMEGFDVRARLGEIRRPGVVLHGAGDCYFTPDSAAALADGLGAELRLLRDAGHVLPLTHGPAIVAAVQDLVAGRVQSAAAASSA